MTRDPKKSATIELRLSHADKEAFKARCAAEGLTISASLRRYIDAELASSPQPRPSQAMERPMHRLRFIARPATIAAAAALAGLFAFVPPSMAQPDLRTLFGQLDANRDQALSLEEFIAGGDEDFMLYVSGGAQGLSTTRPGEVRPTIIPLVSDAPGSSRTMPTREQIAAMRQREFHRMDGDGDARVSFAEFETASRTNRLEVLNGQ